MRPKQSLLVLFICLGVVVPTLAVPGPAPDELERNRRLLESWRADPEHYARLKRDLKAFWELPEEARERLRRLDHDLHEADARTQKHLRGVMERYASWLDRLPEADREQILSTDRSDRLKTIRGMRDRFYTEHLPIKVRTELLQLPLSEQQTQLERLRQQERDLRRACIQVARARFETPLRPPPPTPAPFHPTRLADFPDDVRYYYDNVLWRQIKSDEAEQLKKAEGAPWPLLARTIWELSEKHPVKLPGPVNGPRRFLDLPADVAKAMPAKDLQLFGQRKRLNEMVGRWPDFAAEYALLARKNGVTLPRQLGPCHPKQFDPPVFQFIERTLVPKLTDKEKEELKSAEGHWPEYPRLVVELAKRHGLEVPLMRLPGPRELWEQAKVG